MSDSSEPKFSNAQIAGACGILISLILGLLGALFLKREIGLPEYMICMRNTGWALLVIGIVWTGLATLRRATH
jgi:hypothetical protein